MADRAENVADHVSQEGAGDGDEQEPFNQPPPVDQPQEPPAATAEQVLLQLVEEVKRLSAQQAVDRQESAVRNAALEEKTRQEFEILRAQASGVAAQIGQQAEESAPAAAQAANAATQAAPVAAQAANAAINAAQAAEDAAQRAQRGPPPPNAPIKTPAPPKFKGVGKEPKILEWVYQATNYLKSVGLADHQQGVWHITNFLEGDAATWWRLHSDAVEKGVEPEISNWAALKKIMVERFQVFNHQVDIRDKYQALEQTGSVAKYINEFRTLVVELAEEPMDNQIYQFLKGLKPSIQSSTRTLKPKSLLQAMDIADEADRAIYHAGRRGGNSSSSGRKSSFWSSKGQGSSGGNSKEDGAAPMQLGAVQLSKAEKKSCLDNKLCFVCKKPGHLARDCSRHKAGN